MSDHFNQLRSSLIKRLEKAEPKILGRLELLEATSAETPTEIKGAYNDIALEVFRGFFSELERLWLSNEDKQRELLADLIVNNQDFADHDVSETFIVSVTFALTWVLRQMLEDEAREWFYEFVYNFQQTRDERMGIEA